MTGIPSVMAAGIAASARTGAAAEFLGRSAELASLQDSWQAAAAGQPGLVLVRGGAGVGKTRLVTQLAQLARGQRAVATFSRCFGTAGRLALAPVADWLRTPAVQAAAETLDPVWRAEVSRLVPPKNEPAGPAQPAVDGRRLAAAPLPGGPGPGAARGRAADPAGARQRAVVRPGDPRLSCRSAWAWTRAPRCWWRARCGTTATARTWRWPAGRTGSGPPGCSGSWPCARSARPTPPGWPPRSPAGS